METQTESERPPNGQLISVTRRDTTRLLEVYVKRSLSLNDGGPQVAKTERRKKWVTMPERKKGMRRHSSSPSIPLDLASDDGEIGTFTAAAESPAIQIQPETHPGESEKAAKKTKSKKPSLWKSFLGLFSRKGSEEKEGGEQESRPEMPEASPSREASDASTCLPLPAAPHSVQKRKSIKRRFSKRRLTLRKSSKRDPRKDLNTADITGVGSVVSVEPTYSYYEKVSEEMEKIVKEKDRTDDKVIQRIISLTKQQGDAIDDKLKENPTLNNFFQKMTYTNFQKLADAYLETETLPTNSNHLTVPPAAPELVKLAFTLDFTARIAGLSRQNIGHITGLGNRYLEDRFEYTQACTDHPWSDSDND